MTTERPNIPKLAANPVEPAEPDPGPGWLRSRVLGLPWPRPGHEAPCGRASCPFCAPQASEKPECAPIKPDQPGQALETTTVSECAESRTGDTTDDGGMRIEEAIKHLRRHFHVYEGWDYITLRC